MNSLFIVQVDTYVMQKCRKQLKTYIFYVFICSLTGLFPLLGHAAMNVRPSLLTVYETHFVPLGERLRPGLSGFLSGVLLGLEDGSDHFDRLYIIHY